jgi:hypothetical protein
MARVNVELMYLGLALDPTQRIMTLIINITILESLVWQTKRNMERRLIKVGYKYIQFIQ